MPLLARSLGRGWAAPVAAFGAMLLGGSFMTIAAGQQAPAAAVTPPEPPPPPAVLHDTIPSADLGFLRGLAGQPTKAAMKDKQFRTLMKLAVPRSEYHYGRDMALTYAMEDVLDGAKEPVDLRDGRYVMVEGDRGPYLRGRGFLWFDLESGAALGAFYFQPTNGEPTPTLTVFSRQLTDTVLAMSQLPPEFARDLYGWTETAGIPTVTPRYFIPENGKKYVLLHDEDYCWHPANTPGPPEKVCEGMNAAAADADLNAAWFMKATGNAADATAWMLGPEVADFVVFRNRQCGVALGCRIRMTRERTRVLVEPHPRTEPPRASR